MKARFFWGVAAATLFASPAFALDVERFESLVDKTIAVIDSDNVDVDEIIRYQDMLVDLGIEGVNSFAEKNAQYADVMNFVAKSAEDMKALNLEEIETEWHEGGALEAMGADLEALYDDDEATSYMEAVIHPATAHIAARAYQITGDTDYLDQVRNELTEIVDHLDELED